MFKQQELMKSSPAARTEMYIRQAIPETYRQVLREIRQKEIYKLIVDTNPKHMSKFFRTVIELAVCFELSVTLNRVLTILFLSVAW